MTDRTARSRLWDAILGRGSDVTLPTIPMWSALSANDLAHVSGWPTAATEGGGVDRSLAMSITAVSRARGLVAPTIASCPLQSLRGSQLTPSQPTWLTRSDSGMSPWHRMLWTIDDLIFSGVSAWALIRGSENVILDAARIDIGTWRIDENGRMMVRQPTGFERELAANSWLVIPGPHEGILNTTQRELSAAVGLSRAYARACEKPSMLTELKYTGDADLSPADIRKLIAWWVEARQGKNGGVGFSDKYTEAREVERADSQLLIQGRNSAAVECARAVGIPAHMIDAVTASAGLEYNTGDTRNREFIDYGLRPYIEATQARLSEDDIEPAGRRIRFDLSSLTSLDPEAGQPND